MRRIKKSIGSANRAFWPTNRPSLIIDTLSWAISTPIAVLIRFDGEWRSSGNLSILVFILIGISLNIAFSLILKINSKRQSFSSIEQLVYMFIASSATAIILLLIRITLEFPNLPRSVPILASIIALVVQIGFRTLPNKEIRNNELQNPNLQKILIFGAGKIGYQLAEQLLDYRDIYKLIGFVDDNSKKLGSKILGTKVIGSGNDLQRIFDFFKPDILIVAIANLDNHRLEQLKELATKFDVEMRIIPSEDRIISGFVQLSDIESLDEKDILGRPQVLQENPNVAQLLSNRKVLVTGAAGSIGSEIVRQLHRYGAKKVYLFDRDENGLLRTKLGLDSKSDLSEDDVILGDIRDFEHVNQIISSIKPDIIFHAAALKHVSTLERFPREALKTNFEGTKNVWKAALQNGVPYFVNISSDKAAEPLTELGRSKLLAERIIASTPLEKGIEKYLSVRFGNVIGSNGSFVEIFGRQIERGGPVTVRDPEVTRYFMTVREAVHLVLESLIVGEHQETLILDMGYPVKILEVAKQMIRASGQNIEIIFTGLRPGEKLHERLFSESEKVEFKSHPKIMHTKVSPLSNSESQ